MNTLERDIERALVKRVKQHGGLCLKWVCPGQAGVPDRIVLLPGATVLFVEVKRPKGGRLSALQSWWKNKLVGLGFRHWVIWDTKDLDRFERAALEREGRTP